jgi:hypothetical protein
MNKQNEEEEEKAENDERSGQKKKQNLDIQGERKMTIMGKGMLFAVEQTAKKHSKRRKMAMEGYDSNRRRAAEQIQKRVWRWANVGQQQSRKASKPRASDG